MKKIILSLEKQIENLKGLVQKREDCVDARSAKWQESDACDDYMFKTSEIDDNMNELYIIVYYCR